MQDDSDTLNLGLGGEGSGENIPGDTRYSLAFPCSQVGQTGREDYKGVPMKEADSMKEGGDGDGNSQEEGRRAEDVYKIRSLLLQASLRVAFQLLSYHYTQF